MENKNINKKKVKVIPIDIDVLKTGKSEKNGKVFKWVLYKVVCRVLPKEQKIEMTGFDELAVGKETEVEIWQEVSEKFGKQFKYQTPRRNVWQEIDNLERRIEKLEYEMSENKLLIKSSRKNKKAEDEEVDFDSLVEKEEADIDEEVDINDLDLEEDEQSLS